MNDALQSIAARFDFPGAPGEIRPFGAGHIHDTYRVTRLDGPAQRHFILQRINRRVFADPPAMMENMLRVTAHIRRRLTDSGAAEVERRVLEVTPARNGEPFHVDGDGEFWRAFVCIEGVRSYDALDSPARACKAAEAFARFTGMLSDLPGLPLHETIPGFHDSLKRLRTFRRILEEDPQGRADAVRGEIGAVLEQSGVFETLAERVAAGVLPIRVVHNDTKINNILFDEQTDDALCVIDLDTVMPGLTAHDFGDLVRTTTCPAAEDEPDLAKIAFDRDQFEAIAWGYLAGSRDYLTAAEAESLVLGGKAIVLEQAMRFLTDHLQGDTYYKIARPGHNLDRCRTQLRLYQHLADREGDLNACIQRLRQRA